MKRARVIRNLPAVAGAAPAESDGYLATMAEGMRKSVLKMTIARQIRYGEVKPHRRRKLVDPLGVTFEGVQ